MYLYGLHMYICIYIYVYVYITAHKYNSSKSADMLFVFPVANRPVGNAAPDIQNIHDILTNIANYWTSFGSPIKSIRECRTRFSRHSTYLCVPRSFCVFRKCVQTTHITKNAGWCNKRPSLGKGMLFQNQRNKQKRPR